MNMVPSHLNRVSSYKKEVIFTRVFRGWITRNYEDTILIPKFELNKGESVSIDEDNVYINTIIDNKNKNAP